MSYDVDLTVVVYDISSEDFHRIVESFEEEFIQIGSSSDFFLQTQNLDYSAAINLYVKPFLMLPEATVYMNYQDGSGEVEDYFGKKALYKQLEGFEMGLGYALTPIKTIAKEADAESIKRALETIEASLTQVISDLKRKIE